VRISIFSYFVNNQKENRQMSATGSKRTITSDDEEVSHSTQGKKNKSTAHTG
jgi:hypothetical protein